MVLWEGSCIVHDTFSQKKLIQLQVEYPSAIVVAHPECPEGILDLAEYVGSTAGLVNFVGNSKAEQFIVVTEAGILHKMRNDNPNKQFIPAPPESGCACNECPYMKLNTIDKIIKCMENMSPKVELSDEIIKRSLVPLERMLALG